MIACSNRRQGPLRGRSPCHVHERGVALIVTLAVLAMLTVLLVAFVSNVRTERMASRAFTEQARARLGAQMAIEAAIYQMRTNLSAPDYISRISNVVYAGGVTNPTVFFFSPVSGVWLPGYTRDVANHLALPTTANSNNMNEAGTMFSNSFIANVRVPWAYFTNSLVANSAQSNRSVIRISYWIEDDSTKINVNYAGNVNGPGGTYSRSNDFSVAGMSLEGIPGIATADSASLVNDRAANGLYESLPSIMQVSGIGWGDAYYHNTAAGYPGAVLFGTIGSGEIERQTNGRLRVNINDIATNINPNTAVADLYAVINARYPTFATKYTSPGLSQICANIVDYIDTNNVPTDADTSDFSGAGYFGSELAPHLNEARFEVEAPITLRSGATAASGTNVVGITNRYHLEFFNPFQTNVTVPSATVFVVSNTPPVFVTWTEPAGGTTNTTANATTNILLGGFTVPAYGYAVANVIVETMTVSIPTNIAANVISCAIPTATTTTNIVRPAGGSPTRLDYALIQYPAAAAANFIQKPGGTAVPWGGTNNVHASVASPGDPRFNHRAINWSTNVGNLYPSLTFGSSNQTYRPDLPLKYSDSNQVAHIIVDNGFPFRNGPMRSIGEIGNIGTISNWSTMMMYGDGRPNFVGAGPADYELLDLFTVNPTNQVIRGKMNVNNTRDMMVDRTQYGSMFSLLYGIQMTPGATGLACTNLFSPATVRDLGTYIATNGPYYSIGDLCKLRLLTNLPPLGVYSNTVTDERREAVIRGIANIATVRGQNFTIWGRAQILTTLQGRTNVMGDAMIQALVERRTVHNETTGAVLTQQYKFISYRYLTE